ncbi:hypothetical protein LTR64_000345 [Lithohypha guttulata]|uniref:uncharacterized protein n=1 Tax=Lithohypha guttulata TaxID=1690604 RepID=UPI00315D7281
MDGANGITECPLALGQSETYTFLETQYGTTWYHSHHSRQYGDGLWGTIVIDEPSSANWDIDLGVLPVQDWFYDISETIMYRLVRAQIRNQPVANNILINGTTVNSAGGGVYHGNTIEKPTGFMSSQAGCSANSVTNAVSVFSYEGANNTMPSDRIRNNAPPTSDCVDPNSDLIPWVPLNVSSNETIPQSSRLDVGFAVVQNSSSQTQTLVQWTLDSTATVAEWHHPTLQYVRGGTSAYPRSMNLINLPTKNQWSFWVIQAQVNSITPPPQAHSTHLHGHDF